MIEEVTWNLGGWNTSRIYSDVAYKKERGTTVYTGRPTIWTGKIALAYPSDYGYAANFSQCNQTLIKYNDSTCTSNNWMKVILSTTSNFEWLLTHYSDDTNDVWYVPSNGFVGYYVSAYKPFVVVPTLYLNSDISIVGGTGTSDNPYLISK